MTIADKQIDQIIVVDSEGGVLAIISDNEIIEKTGVSVTLDELT